MRNSLNVLLWVFLISCNSFSGSDNNHSDSANLNEKDTANFESDNPVKIGSSLIQIVSIDSLKMCCDLQDLSISTDGKTIYYTSCIGDQGGAFLYEFSRLKNSVVNQVSLKKYLDDWGSKKIDVPPCSFNGELDYSRHFNLFSGENGVAVLTSTTPFTEGKIYSAFGHSDRGGTIILDCPFAVWMEFDSTLKLKENFMLLNEFGLSRTPRSFMSSGDSIYVSDFASQPGFISKRNNIYVTSLLDTTSLFSYIDPVAHKIYSLNRNPNKNEYALSDGMHNYSINSQLSLFDIENGCVFNNCFYANQTGNIPDSSASDGKVSYIRKLNLIDKKEECLAIEHVGYITEIRPYIGGLALFFADKPSVEEQTNEIGFISLRN